MYHILNFRNKTPIYIYVKDILLLTSVLYKTKVKKRKEVVKWCREWNTKEKSEKVRTRKWVEIETIRNGNKKQRTSRNTSKNEKLKWEGSGRIYQI